jgi:hypothetical protein
MPDTPMVQVKDGGLEFSENGMSALMDMIDGAQEVNPIEKEAPPEPAKEETPEPGQEPAKEPDKPVKTKIQGVKVKGEVTDLELGPDELKEYVQKGAHYTQEMQALRDQQRNLTPYEALIKQVQSDPALSQHIADYFQNKGKPPAQPKQEFDDPIEELENRILQKAKQEILGEVQQKYVQPMSKQAVLDRVQATVQSDPMYKDVQTAIIDYVKAQPPSIGRALFAQLDQNPQAYLEMFEATKERLSKNKPDNNKQDEPLPDPVKKETKAPILETGGSDAPAPTEEKKRAKLDKMKAKAIESGSTEALAAWLRESGGIDHLIK